MSRDTERVTVTVTLPAYQREEWTAAAERLEMSRAEFVRTMVQAGRRRFDLDGGPTDRAEGGSPPAPPGGDGLEGRVHGVVRDRGPLSWDALREAVANDLEERLERTLTDLQASGRIRYSGREGGYVAADE